MTKVMIVDDEEDVLRSTEMLVQLLGYTAIPIQDPGKIIEIAEKEHPGIILQDLKMKDLNIAGLVASLRSNPRTAEIPLVFFSASDDLAGAAAKYDAYGYLAKPFGEKELAQLLERTLGSRSRTGAPTRDMVRRGVRDVFHDYWNHLAALNNYVQILRQDASLNPDARRVIEALDELVLKIESKTDRLRAIISPLTT